MLESGLDAQAVAVPRGHGIGEPGLVSCAVVSRTGDRVLRQAVGHLGGQRERAVSSGQYEQERVRTRAHRARKPTTARVPLLTAYCSLLTAPEDELREQAHPDRRGAPSRSPARPARCRRSRRCRGEPREILRRIRAGTTPPKCCRRAARRLFFTSAMSDLMSSRYSSHSGSRQTRSPARSPAPRTSSTSASSVPITPPAVWPSAMTIAPVSVAMSSTQAG